MGWFGDQVVLGQKPRDNGCICALALVPIALGWWITVQAVAFGLYHAAATIA